MPREPSIIQSQDCLIGLIKGVRRLYDIFWGVRGHGCPGYAFVGFEKGCLWEASGCHSSVSFQASLGVLV